jgi:peptidoglycan/LPS O-acetylase OafA/YrhL
MLTLPARGRDISLDGLRGIAVLMIIFTHLNLLGFAWVSMQLFFVLSGFLITRILIRDTERLTLSDYLKGFYLRRVLRILPAIYLYLLVLGIIAWLFGAFDNVVERLKSAALFFFNFKILLDTQTLPFTDAWAFSFNHLWSLAVEEHFYLVWPFVVYFAIKARNLIAVAIALILLGPVLRWGAAELWLHMGWSLSQATGYGVYILSTTHLDAFAAGALVACLARRHRSPEVPSLKFWAVAVAAAYLLGVLNNGDWGFLRGQGVGPLGYPALMREGSQFIWGYSILNLLFAQLVWLCLHHPGVRTFFSVRPLTFTGEISYGLYLVHFPLLFVFMQVHPAFGQLLPWPAVAMLLWVLLYLACSVGVAWVSYRYFEMPFLHLKDRLQNQTVTPGPMTAQTALAG